MDILLRNVFGLTNIEKAAAIENGRMVTATLRKEVQEAKQKVDELQHKLQKLEVIIEDLPSHASIKQEKKKNTYKSDEARMNELILEQQAQVSL